MKTITKKLNLLDIVDIEEAISKYMDRKVVISEVDCMLIYLVSCDNGLPFGMRLDFKVEDEYFYDLDLFYDDDKKTLAIDGKPLSLNEMALIPKEIFNFDASVFKSFDMDFDSPD